MWKSLRIKTDFALYFHGNSISKREKCWSSLYATHWDLCSQTSLVWLLQLTHEVIRSIRKLEQLRYLNWRIKMIETTHVGIGIDTQKISKEKGARRMLSTAFNDWH
jgi:3-deoxy-manno-octulosonate cytidylyltransferase (CMP-KDO synthetase)